MEIKIIENENLKAQIAAMELSAKNETDFKEEFKQLKELVMKKIK